MMDYPMKPLRTLFLPCTNPFPILVTRLILHLLPNTVPISSPASMETFAGPPMPRFDRWARSNGNQRLTHSFQSRPYNNSGYLQNGATGLPPGAAPLLPNQGRVIQTGPIRVLCIADVRGASP